jgi:hypothetical protein
MFNTYINDITIRDKTINKGKTPNKGTRKENRKD